MGVKIICRVISADVQGISRRNDERISAEKDGPRVPARSHEAWSSTNPFVIFVSFVVFIRSCRSGKPVAFAGSSDGAKFNQTGAPSERDLCSTTRRYTE